MARERPLVLIADDEPDIRELVAYRLEQAGCEVAAANDGVQALRMAKELQPDLALLDVMMPGLDGYEVTERLRRDEGLRGMPIILLTARGQPRDVEYGSEVGANDYIKKPFSPRELRSRVTAALSKR